MTFSLQENNQNVIRIRKKKNQNANCLQVEKYISTFHISLLNLQSCLQFSSTAGLHEVPNKRGTKILQNETAHVCASLPVASFSTTQPHRHDTECPDS